MGVVQDDGAAAPTDTAGLRRRHQLAVILVSWALFCRLVGIVVHTGPHNCKTGQGSLSNLMTVGRNVDHIVPLRSSWLMSMKLEIRKQLRPPIGLRCGPPSSVSADMDFPWNIKSVVRNADHISLCTAGMNMKFTNKFSLQYVVFHPAVRRDISGGQKNDTLIGYGRKRNNK